MVRPSRRALSRDLRRGRPLGDAVEERLGFARVGPFKQGAFPSRLHSERVAAVLGIALGVAIFTCFATGLISHFAQHPLKIGFLSMPAGPSWLYRFTQGLHVASGIAAIPLLIAKLWTVFPKLFTWPPVANVAQVIERISLIPLIGAAFFQLFTGLANTARWYPWKFSFTVTHYWVAWILIGSLLAHIGAKLTITRRALSREAASKPEPAGTGLSRRGFFTAVGAAVAAVTVTTVGQTLRPLKELALLAPRKPDVGPQGFPVNKSAAGAGVIKAANDPGYRLTVTGKVERELSLTLAELRALPQHQAHLPIACVEGWSAGADWGGVQIRELLDRAGAAPDAEVFVQSLQKGGTYSRSQLNVPHARHADTLLALEINGETLHLDHGYPARLIAPNRPGVQQTKWVTRIDVA